MSGSRRALALLLPSVTLALGPARSCVGDADMCADTSWCQGRNCGSWRLNQDAGEKGGAVATCKQIKASLVKKLQKGSNEGYCVSADTSLHGFRCFGGDAWVDDLAKYVEAPSEVREDLEPSLALNRSNCDDLYLEGVQGGTTFMAGLCCAGWAVPCHKSSCTMAWEPVGPGIFNSAISIMLVISAAIHALSSMMCLFFPSRLEEAYRSTEDMTDSDKAAFTHAIQMLGAAHGAFAGVLIFGAVQDWLYGKIQIALVAMLWYAILGPVAEAMQHGTKPWTQSHYLNEFIAVAQGECVGKPPKLNYIVLSISMLIAIGVETVGEVFWLAAAMMAVGVLLSVATSAMPGPPREEEVVSHRESRRASRNNSLRGAGPSVELR
ncbi:hypothetical protein T492DRAFT_1083503 [Pavlovales sp. CCMP2436]|nr:hypothetical protein T492DRAFT_1083503 [Pavlovales sp. CCMP2436]|mmetsp:Transcript_32333/g.80506  ORF Transcript_32333/g.80506 Transcript_32333/m.80506 type:complete len:379 (-) Transcript_32333:217-1353(-)